MYEYVFVLIEQDASCDPDEPFALWWKMIWTDFFYLIFQTHAPLKISQKKKKALKGSWYQDPFLKIEWFFSSEVFSSTERFQCVNRKQRLYWYFWIKQYFWNSFLLDFKDQSRNNNYSDVIEQKLNLKSAWKTFSRLALSQKWFLND